VEKDECQRIVNLLARIAATPISKNFMAGAGQKRAVAKAALFNVLMPRAVEFTLADLSDRRLQIFYE